jgi:hypothetical protein
VIVGGRGDRDGRAPTEEVPRVSRHCVINEIGSGNFRARSSVGARPSPVAPSNKESPPIKNSAINNWQSVSSLSGAFAFYLLRASSARYVAEV